jgi:hypothetical protein
MKVEFRKISAHHQLHATVRITKAGFQELPRYTKKNIPSPLDHSLPSKFHNPDPTGFPVPRGSVSAGDPLRALDVGRMLAISACRRPREMACVRVCHRRGRRGGRLYGGYWRQCAARFEKASCMVWFERGLSRWRLELGGKRRWFVDGLSSTIFHT